MLRGGRSFGIKAHWQPALKIYVNPLTISRSTTVRLLPPRFAGGTPVNVTLLVFPNGPATFHGHKQFVGRRYVVQLNYMTTDDKARYELRRHRVSAFLKRLTRAA